MLDKAIKSAKKGELVSEPPVGGHVKFEVRKLPPKEVTKNVERIQMECDPVGFLMDVVNGKGIETAYYDETGECISAIVHANLKQRIDAAKFLTRIIQPPKQHQHAHLHAELPEDGTHWDKIIGNAARKGS